MNDIALPMAPEVRTRLEGSEWTFPDLQWIHDRCAEHFQRIFGLPVWENRIEIVSAEQMLDAYASNGLPVYYPHWSFGKSFLASQRGYLQGQHALAYEIVLNTRPAIAYLMETNTLAMQALVIAHACFGHNAVFANNHLFRERTHADAILDYGTFARDFVRRCEERHGTERVEAVLDAAHALRAHGVDRYKRASRLDSRREREAQAERLREAMAANARHEFASLRPSAEPAAGAGNAGGTGNWPTAASAIFGRALRGGLKVERYPAEPQDNLLYFIEKHSPSLEPWERELVRIVRKFAEYFHPQRLTKVLNEGFASYTHYTLMHALHEAGQISDAILLEAMESHTSVVRQPAYAAINPYALGFAIFRDLGRMSREPTDEDFACMPDVAGRPFEQLMAEAITDHRDDSFLLQYLGPRVVRDLGLFAISSEGNEPSWTVDAVQDVDGFRTVRSRLAREHLLESLMPEIEVVDFARSTTRALTLRYRPVAGRSLDTGEATKVMRHVKRLWNFPIRMLEAEDGPGMGKLLLTV